MSWKSSNCILRIVPVFKQMEAPHICWAQINSIVCIVIRKLSFSWPIRIRKTTSSELSSVISVVKGTVMFSGCLVIVPKSDTKTHQIRPASRASIIKVNIYRHLQSCQCVLCNYSIVRMHQHLFNTGVIQCYIHAGGYYH